MIYKENVASIQENNVIFLAQSVCSVYRGCLIPDSSSLVSVV